MECHLNEIFKQEFSKDDFDLYISKLKYNKDFISNDSATFRVPNLYLAHWIKTKFHNKLIGILQSHLNVNVNINFIIEDNSKSILTNRKTQTRSEASLIPSFTFENFITGESNKFAYEISMAVASQSNSSYNPVLIHGGTGLGKTHLLNAIGNKAKDKNKNITYVTSEQFLNDYISKIQSNTMTKFREKYRNCDLLLIDDVQFFAGKQAVQEEFFHTFNDLYTRNKKIVLTSDKNIKQITGLEERLVSRFMGGLSASISPPKLETKIKIIKKKCQLNKIDLQDHIVECLAANIGNNIREIEGMIIRLNATSSMLGISISEEMIKNATKENNISNEKEITIEDILKVISAEMNIKISEITSNSKNKEIVRARYITIYLCRKLLTHSITKITSLLKLQNASTISKAFNKVNNEVKANKAIRNQLEELENKILGII